MCCLVLFDFVDGGVVLMSKSKLKSNTSVSTVDSSGVRSGDTSVFTPVVFKSTELFESWCQAACVLSGFHVL